MSSTVSPRCRSSIWLCVLASASARATAPAVVVLLDSARAGFALSANPVVNARRAVPPGGRRTDWRRLTIGSSTGPVVFVSGAVPAQRRGRCQRAAAADEARPIGLVLGGARQRGRGR